MSERVDVIYLVDYDNDDSYEAILAEISRMMKAASRLVNHARSSCKDFTVQIPDDGEWQGAILNKYGNKKVQFRVSRAKWSYKVLERNLDSIKETQAKDKYSIARDHIGLNVRGDFGVTASTIIVPLLSGDRTDVLVDAVAGFWSAGNPYTVLDPNMFDGRNLCLRAERLQCERGLTNSQLDSDFLRLSQKLLKSRDQCFGRLLGGFLNIAAVFLGG